MPTLEENLARPIVSANDFIFVGGVRFSQEGAGGLGLTFAQGISGGSLLIEHGAGSTRYVTLIGHTPGWEAHKMAFSLSNLGTVPEERCSWPLATAVQYLPSIIHADTIFGTGDAIADDHKNMGICKPNGSHYLSSGRSIYAQIAAEPYTRSQTGPFLTWSDANGNGYAAANVPTAQQARPSFGGGFCDIPQWFADAYTQGRNFGIGLGGYQSGQGSSPSPSLFICDRPADGQTLFTNATTVLLGQWQGGGMSEADMRLSRAKRPDDYIAALDRQFGPSPENGVGYWQADQCNGIFWIDTPTKQGFCCLSTQGIGQIDYSLQNLCFSNDRRMRFYAWSPQTLAASIAGTNTPQLTTTLTSRIDPWFHVFFGSADVNISSGEDTGYWPDALYFDPIDDYLYVAYAGGNCGEGGGAASALVVYSIAEGTIPPVGQTRHKHARNVNALAGVI